jgi:hypothetical protein
MTSHKTEAEKKIKSLIKIKLGELEKLEGWKDLPPEMSNAVRHVIIRATFGAFKIGVLTCQHQPYIQT